MYGIIIGIAVVIIAILILLVLVILPPAVFLNPPSAEVGAYFNVNAFFFTPGEIVTVSIVHTSDNQTIDTDAHAVNAVGVLSFSFISSNFSAGDYRFVINSSRGNIIRVFTLLARGNKGQVVPEDSGITGPNNNLIIEPFSGSPGMTIKITATSLKPDCRVTVKVINCLNDICTDNKTVYIRHGEQEFTNGSGTLVDYLETDNNWQGNNYISVDDGLTTISGNLFIQISPTCSCEGLNECGQDGCCAPNFKLASLSGDSVTLCNEYENGLLPQPVIWINFWNSSCPGCTEYMKIIQHIKDTWNKGVLKVFTINAGEDPATVTKFLSDRGYSFYNDPDYPVLFDTDRTVKGRYQPGGDPPHYFLDNKGVIRKTKIGYRSISTEDEVRAIVQEINNKYNQ